MDSEDLHGGLSSDSSEDESKESSPPQNLSLKQKAKIERNRQRALLLKQARLRSRPYNTTKPSGDAVKVKGPPKIIDSGGGFLIEEDQDGPDKVNADIVHPLGALLDPDQTFCDDCGQEYLESYLYDKFSHSVCNNCRDPTEKHKLITKTEAKNKYLLKDADFDKRDPVLAFIVKKNPHNSRWGDMKLYLELQVQKRAMDVWKSEENLEEAKEKRVDNKEKMKQKRYDKKVKELRMAVRSSLYKKDLSSHEHEFGAETYNKDEDTYSKTCTSCGHVMTYEKM